MIKLLKPLPFYYCYYYHSMKQNVRLTSTSKPAVAQVKYLYKNLCLSFKALAPELPRDCQIFLHSYEMIKKTLKGNVLSLDKGCKIHPFPPINHSWDVSKVPWTISCICTYMYIKSSCLCLQKDKIHGILTCRQQFYL